MENTIRFYETDKPYGFFSNFSRHPISIQGKVWPTTEHYFQAMKFPGTEHEESIRLIVKPMDAARAGRERHRPLRPDWDAVKDDIMREAVFAKFTQYKELKNMLIETGDAVLIEHTANDAYWGDGGNGEGRNMLGIILMETRTRLRSQTT